MEGMYTNSNYAFYYGQSMRLKIYAFLMMQNKKKIESCKKITNEEKFTKNKVIPAIKKRGGFEVRYNHGSDEFGKDVTYKYYDNFGRIRCGAVQVKFGNISGGASGMIKTIKHQIEDIFKMSYVDIAEKREQRISQVLVVCSGKFTRNAKDNIMTSFDPWCDVSFLDGQDIDNWLEG